MTVEDPAEAEFYIRHLNYYRLAAYWGPFEADHAAHRFKPGTTFRNVLNLYVFDRELRLLVMDAMERLEVSVRAQWAYQLGHRHGAHAHLNSAIAFQQDRWHTNLDSLKKEVYRSEETFIRHFADTYAEELPPVWAVCEVMSLGLLSRWYANLNPMPTRSAIASVYGVDQGVFASWLHHLTLVRNVCAHHGRLWDREFSVLPKVPQRPRGLGTQFQSPSRKLYNSLLCLLHTMNCIAPGHHWRPRLLELISKHAIPVAAMGFPADWQSRPIWREAQP